MLFLCLRLHCSVLFWSLDALFVFGFPLFAPWTPNAATLRVGCVCRPEFSIIRLKNNSIYLKPDESFVYTGEEFRFHDSSRFRKKAGDAKLRFYTVLCLLAVFPVYAQQTSTFRAQELRSRSRKSTTERTLSAPGGLFHCPVQRALSHDTSCFTVRLTLLFTTLVATRRCRCLLRSE